MWVDLREKGDEITPTYYFDFDLLNQLGFLDPYMFDFIKEMKIMAKKEIKERLEMKKLKYGNTKRK